MAQFQTSFHNGGYAVRVVYSVNSQSVANNTSTVTVEAHLVSLKSSYNISASATKNGRLVINGTTYNFTFNATLSSLQDKKLYTTTVTIPHNGDGTKSFSISCSLGIEVTLSGTRYNTVSTNGNVTLPTIARASSCTMSGTKKFGSTVTFTHTRASSAFTITLTYTCGGASGTIASGRAADSTSWTIPKSLQSQVPKATSIPITIYADTYNGSTLIGGVSLQFTCTIADDCKPSLTTLSCSNPDTGGTTYYQRVSKLRVEVGNSQAYDSPIVKFVMTVDGQTITNYGYIIWSGVLQNSGAKDVTVTITDGRGRTATKTWTRAITVTAYSPPRINAFTCKRTGLDEGGNEVISNLGTRGYFSCSCSWHSNSTNIERKFKYKPVTSDTWSETVWLNYDVLTDYCFNTNLNSGTAYDLQIELVDQVTSVFANIKMNNLFPLINLSSDGTAIAFGKECNDVNKFMVSMDASFNNKTKIYDLEVTGVALCNNIPLKIATSNGTGTYYGNQIWLTECLAISSTGSGGILYLNSAGNHQWVDIHGSLSVEGRGGNNQIMMVETQGDGNGDGDGKTHIGYYDSGLGGYSHYFRGGGKTYINTHYGLYVSKDVTVGQYLRADWLGYASNSGWDGNWGIGCASHFYPTETNRCVGTNAHRWQQLYCVASPNISSDARNKENVKYMYDKPEVISEFTDVKENDEITTHDLLDFVLNDLHMVTFDYKQSTEGMEEGEIEMVTSMNNRQIGFIAQDIENTKVGKYLVTKDKEGILSYESSNWPSIIAGALQQEIRDRQAADKELMDMLNNIINE